MRLSRGQIDQEIFMLKRNLIHFEDIYKKITSWHILRRPFQTKNCNYSKHTLHDKICTKIYYTPTRNLSLHKAYDIHREELLLKIRALRQKISKLKTKKYTRILKFKKSYCQQSLADLVADGSAIDLRQVRFCSNTGREIQFELCMYKESEDSTSYWPRTHSQKVFTPAEIGLARLRGYRFDAESSKVRQAKIRSYAYRNSHKGLFWQADRDPLDSDLNQRANAYRQRIKDSIWVTYIDCGSYKKSPLQFQNIFIYDGPTWVNKKEYRAKQKGEAYAPAGWVNMGEVWQKI